MSEVTERCSMSGHYVLLGYGDVGREIAKKLDAGGVAFVIVSVDDHLLKDTSFSYVVGNAINENALIKAGIAAASTVIIAVSNDSDVIFSTLMCRNLNPNIFVIARANNAYSIDKIYRAGANYVATLPLIAGHMLAHILLPDKSVAYRHDSDSIYEGIEIERVSIQKGSALLGKTLASANIRHKTGCTVIGVKKDDKVLVQLDPKETLDTDTVIVILGYEGQIKRFHEVFG